MVRYRIHMLLVFGLIVAFGCQKQSFEADYELISIPVQKEIRCLEIDGDSLLICGGNTDSKGFVVQADLSLTHFDVLSEKLKRTVYDVTKFQNQWFFGLDSVDLMTSTNLRSFKSYYWQETDWVSNLSKHPIRRFAQTSDQLFAVAGGKLSFGVVYQTEDAVHWNPQEFENDMRAICVYDETVWAAGNGRLMKLENHNDWKRIDLQDLFIVDMIFTSNEEGIAITEDGAVLKSSDGGLTWKSVEKGKRGFVNRMIHANNQFIAVGNEGLIGFSNDSGASWKWSTLEDEFDLNDAVILNGECIVAAEQGMLIRFSLASLK